MDTVLNIIIYITIDNDTRKELTDAFPASGKPLMLAFFRTLLNEIFETAHDDNPYCPVHFYTKFCDFNHFQGHRRASDKEVIFFPF